MNSDTPTLLLVEDNVDDVFIFKRAYKKAQLSYPLQVASVGQSALDYLAGEGAYADRAQFPFPFLVLLDLKLPLKHGLEVLQQLRSRAASADVCVIVLTSSAEPRDILRAHELGAQAFLVKPPTVQMLTEAIAAMEMRRTGSRGNSQPRISGDMLAQFTAIARD